MTFGEVLGPQHVQERDDDGRATTGRFRCENVDTGQVTIITVSRPRDGVIRTCAQELAPDAN